jgi:hypothetical protein
MQLAGHVAGKCDTRDTYRVLVKKLLRVLVRREYKNQMDLNYIR